MDEADLSQYPISQLCFLLTRSYLRRKWLVGLWNFSAIYRGKKGGGGETERSKAENLASVKRCKYLGILGSLIVKSFAEISMGG